ncbi:hypothetical protein K491DRAFT_717235 [Lophiostoma macrostomum CBS 122681]|uniref:Uncharacterized protein n=1 Tax=Lophiostoma macrostomum CBS 122681 TaxID=1314788 RepID=A0A6A6T2J9_9PLEO|nr:hypothetical protein K491DRAFT_717235 [Lophiostoma macrostomum CBS 122681]
MVILGGLEIVIGGAYIAHRRHKKKRRLEEEAEERRHNTFPNEKPESFSHMEQLQLVSPFASSPSETIPPQHTAPPAQKWAYRTPQSPHHSPQSPLHPGLQPSQTFPRRRPLPQYSQSQPPPVQQFQPHIQPLGRSDSFSTLSNMPVANGYRPRDGNPPLPARAPPLPPALLAIPQSQPYSNGAFSASTSALEPHTSGPHSNHTSFFGRGQTVDDNWETYGPHSAPVRVPMGQRLDPEAGEDDPPPPYQP